MNEELQRLLEQLDGVQLEEEQSGIPPYRLEDM